jgi:GcrA cell cycle regulator
MEPTNWAPRHSDALRKLSRKRLSFRGAGSISNGTAYSRNATLGRARRMGLAGPARPEEPSGVSSWLNRLGERRPAKLKPPGLRRAMPSAFEGTEAPKLRCVGIEPRRLSLIQLEHGDCRYPYGGDKRAKSSPSAVIRAAGFELLHAAFPSEPRPRHPVGTRSAHRLAESD